MMLSLLLGLAVPAASEPLDRRTVARPDGSSIAYWLEPGDDRPAEAVLVMQGTGCEPVMTKPNLMHTGALIRPDARTLLIDKSGIGGTDPAATIVEGCPQEYWDRYTLSQRVEDCLRVIADLRRQPWWDGRIILFGGSEGGAVAALLAPLVPEATAVVVLSSGTGVPIGDLIRAAVPPPVAAQADTIFAAARATPTGNQRWAGASYRWWADAVDQVPARSLAQTSVPVLIVHGARDQSSRVATARAGRDLLNAAGKANVTYREFATYDHFMRDADGGEHMDGVLHDVARWIELQASE